MTSLRWLGVVALAGPLGCGDAASNAADGSAGGPEGSTPEDSSPASDGAAIADAGATDDGPSDASHAGVADAGCITGSVSFDLQAAPGASAYCLGAAGTCSAGWLDIRPADGVSFGTSAGGGSPCGTLCNDCQPVACTNVCAVAVRLGDAGVTTTWDGTYFVSGTCGAGITCASQACAPAGNYIASFCGYAASPDAAVFECTGSSTPTCIETPFVWPPQPGSPPVRGILGGDTD